ncbi:MAG: BlaI family penicillinase repressor [Pirellulaceae bacterium]|jgi:BlaI family penicillinase repressor
MGRVTKDVTKDVTETELYILEVLWDHETASVRVIAEEIYPAVGPSQIATVQKLLERLQAKKYIKPNRQLWPHQYEAKVSHAELLTGQLQQLANRMCAGKLPPLMAHLASTLTSAQRKAVLKQLQAK